MIKLKSEQMELRGVSNRQSKNGSVYYLVNAEQLDGTAYQFYCKDASVFPQGLKKGDIIILEFALTYYKNQEQLVVIQLHKV